MRRPGINPGRQEIQRPGLALLPAFVWFFRDAFERFAVLLHFHEFAALLASGFLVPFRVILRHRVLHLCPTFHRSDSRAFASILSHIHTTHPPRRMAVSPGGQKSETRANLRGGRGVTPSRSPRPFPHSGTNPWPDPLVTHRATTPPKGGATPGPCRATRLTQLFHLRRSEFQPGRSHVLLQMLNRRRARDWQHHRRARQKPRDAYLIHTRPMHLRHLFHCTGIQ